MAWDSPGTYSRLLVAADPEAELARLLAAQSPAALPERRAGPVVVDRHSDTEVLEGYAEAQLDALKSVIDRLPATTSNEYETYILSVITQCVKAEMLAASSWRVAVGAGGEAAGRLMEHLRELEATRQTLLKRMPASLSARFDRNLRGVVSSRDDHRGPRRRQRRRGLGDPQHRGHPSGRTPPRARIRRGGRVGGCSLRGRDRRRGAR